MSLSVQIPKEITEYEEKILFGLSMRKLICLVLAVILGIGTFFVCTKLFGMTMDSTSYIIIVEAIPLMALGFVKKDGMPFEKYVALFLRHKIGMNKLSYENKLVVDYIPDQEDETERKSKYAWIFEKDGAAARKQLPRGGRANRTREAEIFTVTKKSREGKRKAARRTTKAARQEYRRIKRQAEKAAKKSGGTQEHDRSDLV